MKHLVLFFFLIVTKSLIAQSISGIITDDKKNPIPFATVFVKELNFGSASNENGQFVIQLSQGDFSLSFQSLGYESQTKKVLMKTANQQISVVLKERVYILNEVTVAGGKEDPAYSIMRKVIRLAPIYNRQIKSSETEIYLRGSFIVSKLSKITKWLAKDDLKKSKIEVGKTYLEESVNDVYYSYPKKTKQVVKSLHSTFPPEAIGGRKNVLNIGSGSVYDPDYFGQDIRSPLAPGAFNYYRFRYEGYQNEGDHIINKIKIIPKGRGKQYITGYLFIVDNLWCIHSFDLSGESTGVKNFNLQKLFAQVKDEVWLPISDHIQYDFDLMGNVAFMRFHATRKYKDIRINPATAALLPSDNTTVHNNSEVAIIRKKPKAVQKRDEKIKKLMEKENPSNYDAFKMARLVQKQELTDLSDSIKKNHVNPSTRTTVVDSNAVNMDSIYWNKIRPIPLAVNEVKSIVVYDSIRAVNKEKDSLNLTPKFKKIKAFDTFLFGGNFISDTTKNWKFDGMIKSTGIDFNTVDGWKYTIGSTVYQRFKNYSSIDINGRMGYAFDRGKLLWDLQTQYRYNQGQNIIQFGAGHYTLDFNSEGATSLENMISSLCFRQNLSRFYESRNYWGKYTMNLALGLKMITSISLNHTLPLTNHSDYSFYYKNERDYALNISNNASYAMTAHRNTIIALDLEYTPGQNYYMDKNNKVYIPSSYPTFSVKWKKSVPGFLGGETNYQFVNASIQQNIKVAVSENLNYIISAGLFFDEKPTDFSEFKHFATQPLKVGVKDFYNTFQLLDYYKYSTNDRFLEAHINYATPFLLLKRLPFIRERVWTEKLIANYLYTPQLKHYTEIGYGIGNELYNIGVFGSFRNLNAERIGLKVALRLFNK